MSGRHYAKFLGDAFATMSPVSAAVAVTKMGLAKLRFGMGPQAVAGMDLLSIPFDHWHEYHLHRQFFVSINNTNEGIRFYRDKIQGYARLRDRGVPFATVVHVLNRRTSGPGGFSQLTSALQFEAALNNADLPDRLFLKRNGGGGGRGAFAIERIDSRWVEDGEPIDTAKVWARVAEAPDDLGFVVQPRYDSHPGLQPVGGEFGLLTCRAHTVLSGGRARLSHVLIKLMSLPSLVDNFLHGSNRRLIAAVDSNGRIERAYATKRGMLLTPVSHHPATGQALAGFQLPLFDEFKHVACAAQEALPECPMLGNDIAITSEGVKVVETNNTPDTEIIQLTSRRSVRSLFEPDIRAVDIDENLRREALGYLYKAPLHLSNG